MSDAPQIRNLFIRRPVFSAVISIVIVLLGLFSLSRLAVESYPPLTPPEIQVQAVYPGATAQDVADAVAAPIEQQLSGMEGLLYFKSANSSDGVMNLSVYFDVSRNPDLAAVDVQNQIARAQSQLPQEVVRNGITVQKRQTAFLVVLALSSDDPRYDTEYLNNYAKIYIDDELKRLPGVGDASTFGQLDFSMLLSLDPDRMAQLGLTVSDVAAAVQEQNATNPAGRIGREPAPRGTQLTIPVITSGRLKEASDFERIIVRGRPDGSLVHLSDIGNAHLGARNYDLAGRFDGAPTALTPVFLRPGGRGASLRDRGILRDAGARLFDQPAHAVRSGARDRHRRGRRDRRDRKRRAYHGRGAGPARRRRRPGDASGESGADFHRPGTVLRVRPGRVLGGHHGTHVQAVRHYHRGFRGPVGHRRAHPDSGAVRRPVASGTGGSAERGGERRRGESLQPVLRWLQSRVPLGDRALPWHRRSRDRPAPYVLRRLRGGGGPAVGPRAVRPERLHSERGQGLLRHAHRAPRQCLAAAHRSGGEAGRRLSPAAAGDPSRRRARRPQLHPECEPDERGDHVRHVEAVGRADHSTGAVPRGARRRQRVSLPAAADPRLRVQPPRNHRPRHDRRSRVESPGSGRERRDAVRRPGGRVRRRRQRVARAARRVPDDPRQHAAAVRAGGPREGEDPWHLAVGAVPDAAGVAVDALHQRFQPLWQDVPGAGRSGGPLPADPR